MLDTKYSKSGRIGNRGERDEDRGLLGDAFVSTMAYKDAKTQGCRGSLRPCVLAPLRCFFSPACPG
jgi:hypothetical protein